MKRVEAALALGVILAAMAVDAGVMPLVELQVRGGRLTVHAEKVPLAVVLERLTAATGLVVYFKDGGEDEPVSVALEDVTLEKALRRILQSRNTIFIYNTDPRALAAVHVLGAGGLMSTAVTASGETNHPDSDDGEPGLSPEILRISAIEAELAPGRAGSLGRAEELWAETDSGVRLTALQRLAEQPETRVDSLAGALVGHDLVVQSAAQNMILNYGVNGQALEDVLAAAQEGDEASVRAILGAALIH